MSPQQVIPEYASRTSTISSGVRLRALIALLCASMSQSLSAQATSQELEFNIPSQSVKSALHQFSRQSDLQVLLETSGVDDVRANEVKGHLSPEAALGQLLRHTDFVYQVRGRTAVIKRVAARPAVPAETSAQTPSMRTISSEAPESQGTQKSSEGDSKERRQQGLEEVIVTAQKRAENLQDVPISISVLGGRELDRSTGEGVTEALSRVPGVGINATYQGGGTQVAIRGVTAGGALFNGSSPVSYYLDSVPFGLVRQAIVPDVNAYDLERVEVLRGPQGTLYGASAQNGVVRVLTSDANPDELAIKARTSASSTRDGGENYRGDVAVNVPIVAGKLAARAVLGYQDMSGWIDRANRKNINDAEIKNMRFKVGAKPTEKLSLDLSAWISRADFGGPSIADDNGIRLATYDEPISTDFDAYSVGVAYELPAVSIASTTSYLEYTNDGFLDLSVLAPGQLDLTRLNADVLSQEVLFNSEHEGPWLWSVGGIYRDAEDRQFQRSYVDGTPLPAVSDQIYVSKSFAVFGQVTRSFLEGSVELTGGIRYFEDEVTSRDDLRDIRGSDQFDALSPRLVLTWHPTDDLTTYVSYARGFRSGFPQSGFLLSVAPEFPSVDADTLINYEIGAKGKMWDGLVSFDTAVYLIDWQDVQQSLTVPVTATDIATALVNGESASGLGIDFGITARPLDGLELSVNVSWNDLTMDSEVRSFPGGSAPPEGVVLFAEGDRLNISPEYTGSASAAYDFQLGGSGLNGRLDVSANYTSEMDSRTIVSGAQSIAFGDSMMIGRVSFAVDAPDHWTATLFVDNVTNEQGSPVRFPIFREFLPWDTRIRPRTIGVQLEYEF